MWNLIELIINGITDFDVVYHRDLKAFTLGCVTKIGMIALGALACFRWYGGFHFLAWFFGIPAVILLIFTLKHEWTCFCDR